MTRQQLAGVGLVLAGVAVIVAVVVLAALTS